MSPGIGCGLALCLLAAVAGCRLPGRGPVSGEVLNCRQLTQRGISAMDRGQWDEAESYLSQAVRTCPVDCDARRHYAQALWQRGARTEALAQIEEAIHLSADDPSLLIRCGQMHLEQGQIEPALDCAGQALDLDPQRAEAWILRGQAMRRAGDLRQALADFHRGLSCSPGDRDALLETAELYRQMNQPQRALASLHTLADTYPIGEEPQEVAFLSGLALTALGRHDEAIEQFQSAASEQPTPENFFRLAEAHLNAGRLEPARQAAQQALAIEPRHLASQQLLERMAQGDQRRLQR
jgi:tetratricopeptide (TPR) repeat protein